MKKYNEWPNKVREEQDIEKIKKFRILASKNVENEISESTSTDLNLKDVFRKINRSYTLVGSQVLFDMLHKPLYKKEELDNRRYIIDTLKENEDLRNKYINVLEETGYDKYSDYLDILFLTYKRNLKAFYFALFLLISLIALIIYTIITKDKLMFFVLPIVFGGGTMIMATFKRSGSNVKLKGFRGIASSKSNDDADMKSFLALTRIIDAGIGFTKINDTKDLFPKLYETLSNVSSFRNSVITFTTVSSNEFFNMIAEILFIKFFLYENATKKISENRDDIISFIIEVGKVDALLSLASYEKSLENELVTFCKAEHVKEDSFLNIEDAKHPLVENCVKNSVMLDKEGIILTGSNMSGKSTFMRTLGINILFSQVMGISLSKSYRGSFFKIISALTSQDDITEKKSYFMDEAEGILNIINNMDENLSTFVLIDEIFRGTNPIERISASCKIIDYIQSKNAICIVATHDKDIVYLAEGKFKKYYFDEDVIDGKLKFNYILKEGIAKSTNAIKLMEQIGYPKEITDGAKYIVSSQKELADYRILK